MTHSANELETLATKAARGSGAPAAQAALFGKATAHHIAANRDPGDLQTALANLPGGPIITLAITTKAPQTPLEHSYADRDQPLPGRLTPDPDLIADLTERAQNTYVPNTDASRSSGAGAGLTDND